MYPKDKTIIYKRSESAVFKKTKEQFGGLSNMAGGFPLQVNGIGIYNSEALYQACRFPNLPEVQEKIIAEKSPMTAKMVSKPHRKNTRPDWQEGACMTDLVCVRIMKWCLRVKLAQNWEAFSKLLEETGDLKIVEESQKDSFWGAKPIKDDEEHLEGQNVLGRLLMELRYDLDKAPEALKLVEPLDIKDFLLYGEPIGKITTRTPIFTVPEKELLPLLS